MVSVHYLKYTAIAIVFAAVLALLEWGYIRIARRYHIGTTVPDGDGGARKRFVAVGGGFIFILAAVIAVAFYPAIDPYLINVYMYVGGGALLAVMSYADDLVHLSPRLRLAVHVVVTALVLYMLPFDGRWWLYAVAVVACTGYINASNFMDGSNGMLALYSAVVLASLVAVHPTVICVALLVAVAVFAVFNCRTRALVYSGDVGSITLGFFIATTMVYYILLYGEYSMAVFVAVFLVDTFCTFAERLVRGDNVLLPHHRHLYQRLIRGGCPQLAVAAVYAGVQLAVNAGWFVLPQQWRAAYAVAVALVLLALYIITRSRYKA